jgi:hypothetical protein
MTTKALLMSATLAAMLPASAQIVLTEHYSYTVGGSSGSIPDTGQLMTFAQTTSASRITELHEVRLTLTLTGGEAGTGWAGDMFVSLNRDLGSQTAIILNQVGVTPSDFMGYSYNGWNATFRDDAANGDVHFGQPATPTGVLTGSWQPDGRVNPEDASGSSSSRMAVFNGLNGAGTWYLNIADLADSGHMTLAGWELTLVGFSPVPEPEEYAAMTAAGLAAFALWRKKNRRP